jgi:hypothetical protein
MAKERKKADRELTRKEMHFRRRDQERNRRVVYALIGVTALIVLLLGAGLLQEWVIKPNQPVAVVDGQPVNGVDYAKRVRFAWLQQAGQQQTDNLTTASQVVDQMIDDKVIASAAKARNLSVSDQEINTALEQTFGFERFTPTPSATPSVQPTKEPTPTPGGSPTATPAPTATPISEADYQKSLKDYETRLQQNTGMNDADFRSLVASDLLRRKVYDEVTTGITNTEVAVRARHILVSVRTPAPTATPMPAGTPAPTVDPSASPTPMPRDDAQALARIVEAKNKLGSGIDFATVAKEYSDDPGSAAEGGELGWFAAGQMVPAFDQAAFTLPIGTISDPVKTDFGYHIIQVEEKDANHPMDEYTLSQKKYEAFTKWMADARTAAKITRNWTVDRVPATPTPGP